MLAPDTNREYLIELSTLEIGPGIPQDTADQFSLHLGELSAYCSAYQSLKGSPPPQISVSVDVYRRLARLAGSFRLCFFEIPIHSIARTEHSMEPAHIKTGRALFGENRYPI